MANSLEKRKYFFIYKTTNLINGKYYIGMHSTSNLKDGYLGSGTYLRRSIRKYGKENFKCKILEFCRDREELVKREQELVHEELIKDPLCMNLKLGGSGGFSSEVAKLGRAAVNKILLQKYGENFRQIIGQRFAEKLKSSSEERLLFSDKCRKGWLKKGYKPKTFLNKKHTDETKLKMSKSKKETSKGERNSQHDTIWVYNLSLKKSKKIKKSSLIQEGWVKGRKMKF